MRLRYICHQDVSARSVYGIFFCVRRTTKEVSLRYSFWENGVGLAIFYIV